VKAAEWLILDIDQLRQRGSGHSIVRRLSFSLSAAALGYRTERVGHESVAHAELPLQPPTSTELIII